MKKIFIMIYMFFIHPILFWKYTIKKKSRFFLANGRSQNIKTKNFQLGRNVRTGNNTRINFFSDNSLTIGNDCYMGQRNSFLVGGDIKIGNGVLMASDVLISSENHGIDPLNPKGYGGQGLVMKPVSIEDGCWIGEKVIILPGVTVGEKSIIGAGSVVTKSIPPYSVAVGNPAKVIKEFDSNSNRWIPK